MEESKKIDSEYYNNNIIESELGENLDDFIKKISGIAQTENISQIVCVFNGFKFIITPEHFYNEKKQNELKDSLTYFINKKEEIYLKSEEGMKNTKEQEEKQIEKEEKRGKLIENLEVLDFSDNKLVLEWLCNFEKTSGNYNKDKLLKKFSDNGFEIGINTGKDFNLKNSDNFAKYIVGQALNGIKKVGIPHHIIHKFTNEWKKNFGEKKIEENQKINKLLQFFKK